MSSVLTIGGSTINRFSTRVILNRLTLSLDRPDELEFTELSANLPGTYAPEQAVTLTVDGTLSFSGWIFSRHPDGFGESSGRVGYRCLGLSYGASLVPITAADGTGTMAFNLPVNDPNYVATEAGLDVGTIITQVLNQHASQLTAIGITSYTAGDLSPLAVVPPDAVYVSGNSLWVQLQQLVQLWYGSRYALYVTPAGVIRCYDTNSVGAAPALTAETITLDSDPALLTGMNEDTSECYTQVILRGRDDVEPAYLSLHDGTLVEGWTSTDQSNWNIGNALYPTGAYDVGSITAITSTVVTVQSDSASETWASNFWNGIQGQMALIWPAATNIQGFEYRHVTACSALSAGGTATVTLDRPLSGSSYTRYQLRGEPGGLSNVWRKYTIPNAYVAEHLVQQFNFGVQWAPTQNEVTLVTSPMGVVCFSQGGISVQFPFQFEVVPYDGTTDGYILAYQPVVTLNNSQSALQAGGSSVIAPDDIQVMLPYSRGALTVTSPMGGGYSGTANSLFGVQRTLYRDYPTWVDAGNSSNMQTLADNILSTVSNAIQEGSVVYLGKFSAALIGGSWPICLNVAKAAGTTGYESMNAPVRTFVLEWPQSGAAEWVSHLSFSTRRQQYSGDRLYVHPMYAQAEGGLFGEQGLSWSRTGEGKAGGGATYLGDAISGEEMMSAVGGSATPMDMPSIESMVKPPSLKDMNAADAAALKAQDDALNAATAVPTHRQVIGQERADAKAQQDAINQAAGYDQGVDAGPSPS